MPHRRPRDFALRFFFGTLEKKPLAPPLPGLALSASGMRDQKAKPPPEEKIDPLDDMEIAQKQSLLSDESTGNGSTGHTCIRTDYRLECLFFDLA
jgi:hypothetical protein